MALEPITDTLFAVARGDDLLTPLYDTEDGVTDALDRMEHTMRAIGLEPDVEIVELQRKTTYTKPKPYKAPETLDAETTPQP